LLEGLHVKFLGLFVSEAQRMVLFKQSLDSFSELLLLSITTILELLKGHNLVSELRNLIVVLIPEDLDPSIGISISALLPHLQFPFECFILLKHLVILLVEQVQFVVRGLGILGLRLGAALTL
jgi:hypothetical protein